MKQPLVGDRLAGYTATGVTDQPGRGLPHKRRNNCDTRPQMPMSVAPNTGGGGDATGRCSPVRTECGSGVNTIGASAASPVGIGFGGPLISSIRLWMAT